jgi:cytoskeletal protein CcmA (bactofilin family)
MKQMLRIVCLFLLVMLVFVPFQPAAAQGASFGGQVIFGQSFNLKSGETMNGDLLVFGGTAALDEGSIVNGNVVLFGGTLVVKGEVSGDVVVTGGSANLGATAHIHGNLTTVGATLERLDGAQIDGQISNTATSWAGSGANGTNPIPPVNPVPYINLNFNPIAPAMNAFGQALSLALLAMLIMLFLAPHADRVAHAIIAQPLPTGGIGLLTIIVTPIALVLLAITLILIPVVVVVAVALFVAGIFGWIAIGYEVGQRFTKAIHQNWHPSFSAGLGVFALTLVSSALTGIPVLNCVGWLVPFLLTVAGLGAVIMTRFGTRTVLSPAAITPTPFTPTSPIASPVEPATPIAPVLPEPAVPQAEEPAKNN